MERSTSSVASSSSSLSGLTLCCLRPLLNPDGDEEYYEILGVSRRAPGAAIKQKYRKLALQQHPDKRAQRGEAVTEADVAAFQRAKEAYECLSDPKRRRIYDALGEDGLKWTEDPTLATPQAVARKAARVSVACRCVLLFFLFAALAFFCLFFPILFALKVDGVLSDDGPSFAAIFAPLWILNLLGLLNAVAFVAEAKQCPCAAKGEHHHHHEDATTTRASEDAAAGLGAPPASDAKVEDGDGENDARVPRRANRQNHNNHAEDDDDDEDSAFNEEDFFAADANNALEDAPLGVRVRILLRTTCVVGFQVLLVARLDSEDQSTVPLRLVFTPLFLREIFSLPDIVPAALARITPPFSVTKGTSNTNDSASSPTLRVPKAASNGGPSAGLGAPAAADAKDGVFEKQGEATATGGTTPPPQSSSSSSFNTVNETENNNDAAAASLEERLRFVQYANAVEERHLARRAVVGVGLRFAFLALVLAKLTRTPKLSWWLVFGPVWIAAFRLFERSSRLNVEARDIRRTMGDSGWDKDSETASPRSDEEEERRETDRLKAQAVEQKNAGAVATCCACVCLVGFGCLVVARLLRLRHPLVPALALFAPVFFAVCCCYCATVIFVCFFRPDDLFDDDDDDDDRRPKPDADEARGGVDLETGGGTSSGIKASSDAPPMIHLGDDTDETRANDGGGGGKTTWNNNPGVANGLGAPAAPPAGGVATSAGVELHDLNDLD